MNVFVTSQLLWEKTLAKSNLWTKEFRVAYDSQRVWGPPRQKGGTETIGRHSGRSWRLRAHIFSSKQEVEKAGSGWDFCEVSNPNPQWHPSSTKVALPTASRKSATNLEPRVQILSLWETLSIRHHSGFSCSHSRKVEHFLTFPYSEGLVETMGLSG